MGECVPQSASTRDGGVSDASISDGSVRTDGSVIRDSSVSDTYDTPIVLTTSSRGCQCSAPGAAPSSRAPYLGVALAALLFRRRRARRA